MPAALSRPNQFLVRQPNSQFSARHRIYSRNLQVLKNPSRSLSFRTAADHVSRVYCCQTERVVLNSESKSSIRRPPYIPNRIPDSSYVRIFDTTLRDGEQSPGASLTAKEKVDIARQLAKLGVDIIEAGFPAASKEDFEAVKMIAKEVGNAVDEDGYVPVICGLSRCNEKDIRTAWEAVKYSKRPRIHTFIATSEIHMEHKLRKTREQVIEIARNMVQFARSLGCDDVEFSPEDAGRFDLDPKLHAFLNFLFHRIDPESKSTLHASWIKKLSIIMDIWIK